MVGSRDQRTQLWKRAIQIPFHQSLAAIGPVVSEEKIKVYDGRTDRRRTPSDGKSSPGLWPGELKKGGGINKRSSHIPLNDVGFFNIHPEKNIF